VRPAGSASVTATPVASLGPAFASVTVKVTFCPWIGLGLLTVFVRLRSALDTTVVGSLAVSSPLKVSPPPDAEAVLVTLEAALCATLAVTVMAG